MQFLLWIKIFLKKYWKLLALVIVVLFSIILFKGDVTSFIDDYRKIQNTHDEEVKEIKKALANEREQKAMAQQRLNDILTSIEKEYKNNNLNLEKKKKKEIEKIVRKSKDNPEILAQKLSKATGFRVILSSD